jgi:hypothetical protein
MKLIAAFATLLLCSTFALQANDAKPNGPDGMKGKFRMGNGGQGGGQMREKMRARMLEMFDANHDGKLEGDEIEKAKAFLQEKRAEFAQKHPELAGKLAEKMKERKKDRAEAGGAGPQKTSATSDEKQALQKAMEDVNQDPPVKL